ncbi:MAG: hypothetical protein ACE5KT_02880, partial [Methanosarcinales archaeon]
MKALLIIETNGLVSIVMKQDINCKYFLTLADDGVISVEVPEYSFYEAHGTMKNRLHSRLRKLVEFSGVLNDYMRNPNYNDICRPIKQNFELLRQRTHDEIRLLKTELNRIKQIVQIIPHNESISTKAKLRHISSEPPFKLS